MLSVRPVSERQARFMLMGMTLSPVLSLILAPFIASSVFAWRSWWSRPYYFWRPLTLVSLTVALIAARYWPYLGGQGLYSPFFDDSSVESSPSPNAILGTVLFCTVSYIVWSVAMLPHNLARIALLIVERNRNKTTPAATTP